MGQLIIEQIVSADGYAADAEGGISFFENARHINEADTDQLNLLASVEAMVLGRRTFDMFAAYWPQADPNQEPVARPLNALRKFVVSTTLQTAPWGRDAPASILRSTADVRALCRQCEGDVIVWGSLTLADALLRNNAVDRLRLRVLPKLIGAGRPATPPDLDTRDLHLRDSRRYPGGLAVLDYAFAGRDGAGA